MRRRPTQPNIAVSKLPRTRTAALTCCLVLLGGASSVCAAPKAAKAPKAPASAAAEDGLPKPEDVANQARAVFTDLDGNSDPRARTLLFDGRVSLGKEDRQKALEAGVVDLHWPLRQRALALALVDKDKKLQGTAMEALAKLLASNEKSERDQGVEFLARPDAGIKPADLLKLWQRAAVEGGPEARGDARAAIVKLGGKPAWDILAAGLAEATDSKEFLQAVALLATYKDGLGAPWALSHMNDKDQLGTLARGLLVRIDEKKAAADIVKQLQAKYEKAEFAERINAATILSLRGLGTPAIARSLAKGAKFTDPTVRLIALEGLREVRDPAVLGELRERVSSNENEEEARLGYEWLFAWGKANGEKQVVDLLQEIARSDRRSLRLRAIDTLARLAHRPSAPLFEAAMGEGQPEIRLSSARGLRAVARAGDEKRIGDFLRREPDLNVRMELVAALAAIGTPEILDPLQFVITAPQVEMRRAAIAAVGPIGTPKAASLVGLRRADADLDTRFAAGVQLIHIDARTALKDLKGAFGWMSGTQVMALADDPKVTPDILELIALEGNDDQRGMAVDGLAKRGEAAATRLLSLIERSQFDETAGGAMAGLAAARKEASVPTYREALKSKHGRVRAAAVAALGAYGPPASLEVVLPLLSDKEPLVRAEAALAAMALSTRKPAP
jgi:HEAT repeat protein